MCRKPLFALRRPDERRRIAINRTFASQIFPEGADGRELPRRRGAGVPTFVEVAEKRSNVQMIEVRGGEIRTAAIEVCGNEADELRQIAFVCAHGVGRRVLVEA